MHYLNDIKLLKRGKLDFFTPEDIKIIETFQNLGDGFMEIKQITRFGKLMDRVVAMRLKNEFVFDDSSPIRPCVSAVHFNKASFEFGYGRFMYPNHKDYRGELAPDDAKNLEVLIKIQRDMGEIGEKLMFVARNRWMRNGVIPKTLLNDKPTKEIPEGKVDEIVIPVIKAIGEKINATAVESMRARVDRILEALKENRGVLDASIVKNGKTFKTDEELEKMIKETGEHAEIKFIHRICDKLGGMTFKMKLLEAKEVIINKDDFGIHFTFEGDISFSLCSKVVLNWSPLGNAYYQFPMTFHNMKVTGMKVIGGEADFKNALAVRVK